MLKLNLEEDLLVYYSMSEQGVHMRWLVGLMVVALTGLVAVQIALLSNAMELKERAFRRNIATALERVSQDLAAGEAATAIFSTLLPDTVNSTARIMAIVSHDSSRVRRLLASDDIDIAIDVDSGPRRQPLTVTGDTLRYVVESPRYVRISAEEIAPGHDTVLVDRFHQPGTYKVVFDSARLGDSSISWNFVSQSDSSLGDGTIYKSISDFRARPDSGKLELVAQVFQGMLSTEQFPIEERLKSSAVDSTLKARFASAGIDLEFAYGLFSNPDDSLRLISDSEYVEGVSDSPFRVRLFPQDVFGAPSYLGVYFPGRQVFLWSQIAPLLGASVLFMAIVAVGFGVTLRSLSRQRRLSALMVDFVNNMTHEFKTPISTVSLAAEALDSAEVSSNSEKVQQFNDLIKTETLRMRNQTEKILQMAALEEREIQLNYSEFNLHDLLNETVKSLALRTRDEGGLIETEFMATRPVISADRVHITNIAHNLLDNALKYSPESPRIRVRTFDSDNGVGFRIVDNGMGIAEADQRLVFEKYFRAHTGDVHDVKGFGIGLSYVKLMVDAHGGRVSFHSKQGEGTEVEVVLPNFPSGDND